MPLTSFVPHVPLSEYQERLKEHFVMERTNGVLEVRMHTRGGEAVFGFELHRALHQMLQAVGQDPENEVMILTSTGTTWINQYDQESFETQGRDAEAYRKTHYDMWYADANKLIDTLLWQIDIPLIGAINGPGFHIELPLLCDLTIATDDTRFMDPHFFMGVVPGDGQFLIYQNLIGLKRANHMMYLNNGISAQEALEWGLVGEILPRADLLPRAREMAQAIMSQDRSIRRLTAQVARRRWKRLFTDDFSMHVTHEMYGAHLSRIRVD